MSLVGHVVRPSRKAASWCCQPSETGDRPRFLMTYGYLKTETVVCPLFPGQRSGAELRAFITARLLLIASSSIDLPYQSCGGIVKAGTILLLSGFVCGVTFPPGTGAQIGPALVVPVPSNDQVIVRADSF